VHLLLIDYCVIVGSLDKTNAEKAIAILWYFDRSTPDVAMSSGKLAKVLDDHHIGTSNPTLLGNAIRKLKLASESKGGFFLKPGSRELIRKWLPEGIDGIQPTMDHEVGYLPEPVWKSTRNYVESVCRQLNGCFRSAYYDAAAVMLRRLLETLIIESYEHLNRTSEIKDSNGNYFMLKDLVERACGEKGNAGLNLGRDSKATLKDARDVGNWSAHARRYNAFATDLAKLQAGVRIAAQELIQIADIKKQFLTAAHSQ
jgi:hypothetical protein